MRVATFNMEIKKPQWKMLIYLNYILKLLFKKHVKQININTKPGKNIYNLWEVKDCLFSLWKLYLEKNKKKYIYLLCQENKYPQNTLN